MTTFEVKDVLQTKYNIGISFRYTISVSYNVDKCYIQIISFHKKRVIYTTIVTIDKYDETIQNIKNKMKNGDFLIDIVKDYGRCVGCKNDG